MSTETIDTPIMTPKEVSDLLRLSKITIYNLTLRGEIPGFKIGNSWRYNRNAIEAIINDAS